MGWRVVVANGLVLGGIAWMLAQGTETQAVTLLPEGKTPNLEGVAALETQAALSPTAPAVAELAGAYLDRDQPGLATAVIEKASIEIRSRPDIGQLHARALFNRGQAREALAVARDANSRCDALGVGCAPWLVAKTSRQLAFLEEVVAAGIEDPQADPAATMAAYERSAREVRLVAMR
jgi:hypothetical protein